MDISIYGAGYVGLVSAVCLSKLGHRVVCADINEQRIAILNAGECPIYEEQLPELLREQLQIGCLNFTTDLSFAIQKSNIHIIATGTPSLADGSADLSQVFVVAARIAREINDNALLVIKSTVPVGTGNAIEKLTKQELDANNKSFYIDVASNPEFLREGTAVKDFMYSDRIVIGGTRRALKQMQVMYQPLVDEGVPLLCMSRQSAELTKYASNAMLACRISFINQISLIAEKVDANIDEIKYGIGLDQRIGSYFLNPGIGYGGSCFPKDIRALRQIADSVGVDSGFIQMIEYINNVQKHWVIEQLNDHYGHGLKDRVVGIWGLSFKPGTDDLREASSLVIINRLIELGVTLRLYDPVAMSAAKAMLPDLSPMSWCSTPEEVLSSKLDALIIATEWPIFKLFSLTKLANALGSAPIIDGRNCFDLSAVQTAGITCYYSVGRPRVLINKERKTTAQVSHERIFVNKYEDSIV